MCTITVHNSQNALSISAPISSVRRTFLRIILVLPLFPNAECEIKSRIDFVQRNKPISSYGINVSSRARIFRRKKK